MSIWQGVAQDQTRTVQIQGVGTFDLTVNYDGTGTNFDAYDFGAHGQTESGLIYDNNISILGTYLDTIGPSIHTYTLTFNNFTNLDGYDGIIYFEGLSNKSTEPNPTYVTFAATGTGTVADWTQQGSLAPRGGNDNMGVTFEPSNARLVIADASDAGDAAGIFLNLGDMAAYTQVTMTFDAEQDDGAYLGFAAVPEPSSYALHCALGVLIAGLMRRKRTT